jgi:glutamate-ammonia-ligase adenylyltransferase
MQSADISPAEHATPALPPAAYSRFWQRLHRRYDALFPLLPAGAHRATMEQASTPCWRGLELAPRCASCASW